MLMLMSLMLCLSHKWEPGFTEIRGGNFSREGSRRENGPPRRDPGGIPESAGNLGGIPAGSRYPFYKGRHDGPIVGVLVSRLNSPGSSPGWGHYAVFLARHFALTVPLSTQVYQWVLTNLMLGVTL